MKKVLRIAVFVVVGLIAVFAGLLTYVKVALPNVGDAPKLKVERTDQRIERGKYLATSVCVCMDCHSSRDWNSFALPLVDGTLGKGGERFDQHFGFPGVYYSRNITPSGISRYTDGELYRAITTGVTKEGKALFPVMPYPYYGKMDPEDIKCIIAYIRTLPAIPNEIPASSSDVPMNFIINLIPKKAEPMTRPDTANRLAYGAYLTNAAGCIECHTKDNKGQIIKELAFSGGREFKMPGFLLRSSNITPDIKTGIGSWTEQTFIDRFKAYDDSGYVPQSVKSGSFNTIMPWTMYAKMKQSDLAAIYTYLKSLPARENKVDKFVVSVQ